METVANLSLFRVTARPGSGLELDLASRRVLYTIPTGYGGPTQLRGSNVQNLLTFAQTVQGQSQIMVLDADTGVVRQVTNVAPGGWGVRWPSFSPDDQCVAFNAINVPGMKDGIYSINLDGSGLRFITGGSGSVVGRPMWKR